MSEPWAALTSDPVIAGLIATALVLTLAVMCLNERRIERNHARLAAPLRTKEHDHNA